MANHTRLFKIIHKHTYVQMSEIVAEGLQLLSCLSPHSSVNLDESLENHTKLI